MKAENIQRVLNTIAGTAPAESGIYGSKFFALLRLIERQGEPVKCDDETHKLHGLKALQIEPGKWVAIHRKIFAGGYSACTFYILATPTAETNN